MSKRYKSRIHVQAHSPHARPTTSPFRSELQPSHTSALTHATRSSISSTHTTTNMSVYYETSTPNFPSYSTTQEFSLPPENHLSSVYADAHTGPWGWQWKGVQELVSTSPSSTRITIRDLMDDIEKVKYTEGCRGSFITDKECSECTGDVQNCHGLVVFNISRVPFHRRRTVDGGAPQPP